MSFRSLESPFRGSPALIRSLSTYGQSRVLPNTFSRFPGKYAFHDNMTSLQRSLSISSTTSSKTIVEAVPSTEEDRYEATDLLTELRTPFPRIEEPLFHSPPVVPQPSWLQELMQSSSSNRHSRASSIVSTRTRFSTTTLDDMSDAQSIDLNLGGQYFRISRDGSRITDELPPPYSGPQRLRSPDPLASRSSSLSFRGGRSRSSSFFDATYSEAEDDNDGSLTAVHRSPINTRANILDPSEIDMPSPVDGARSIPEQTGETQTVLEDVPERNPSWRAGPDIISVAPEARQRRTVSAEAVLPGLVPLSPGTTSRLRRRNLLPTLMTEGWEQPAAARVAQTSTQIRHVSTSPVVVRSAGAVLESDVEIERPASPHFIGRNAHALFPRSERSAHEGFIHNLSESSTRPVPAFAPFDTEAERNTPPAMDSENDISLHYARQMRSLDRDHRKALHLKDKELEKLRERLNEVDTVYRQELRARDFIIEDLKKRLEHLEEVQESQIEKARNQVEDTWESRWKDRDFHLRERMRRIEEEAQRNMTVA